MRFFLVLFILLGFPVLELFVLIKLAGAIGWWLLLWLILAAFTGWTLIQEEKLAVFGRLFSSLQSGQPLGYVMLDSLRTLFAGVLLIFPGVVSDVMALLLLALPRPRRKLPAGQEESGDIIIEGEWQREEKRRLK